MVTFISMGKRKNKHPSQNPKNVSASTIKEKQKEKKKKQQKNSRDKDSTMQDLDSFQSEISQLKEQALTTHKEAVKIAKKTYGNLIDSIDQSDIILQVLDARDPHACRILEVERIIKEKGKQLINVINKVDLIPQEVAIRWLGDPSFRIDELSQLLDFNSTQNESILSNYSSNVIVTAISSKAEAEQKQAWNLLHEVISAISANLQHLPTISIIGINHVGKSAICSILNTNNNDNFNKVLEVPSYAFILSTDAAALLNAIEYCGDNNDFWLDFLSRANDESIFDVLAIEQTKDIDDVMNEYAKVIQKSVAEATNEITGNLISGSQPFFSIPEDTPVEKVSDFQQIILDSLSSTEDDDNSIHINRGDPLTIDENLLQLEK